MAVERIRIRRDTAATWTSENPTLGLGELGLETDAGYLRVGDGATAWNSLAGYVGQRVSIEYGKRLGELYWLDGYEAPAAWNAASPDDYHPGLCLSAIDGHTDISTTNWPDLVPHIRARDLVYLKGKTGEASSWTASVSGSNITMPSSTSSDAVLAALVEDQLVNGSYTDWRTVNVAGADFVITAINTATRVITVTGTPASGTQTVKFYPHRIAGSTTTARVFEVNGRTLVSAGDADGEAFAGLLRRDRMQGWQAGLNTDSADHYGASQNANLNTGIGSANANAAVPRYQTIDQGSAAGIYPFSDGTNGTPRTGTTTDPRAMIGHLYLHARRYLE